MRTILLLLLATFAIAADQRPIVISTTTGQFQQLQAGSRLTLPTSSGGFATTIDSGAQTATRVFTLPVTSTNDTFGMLGIAQSWSGVNTYTGSTFYQVVINPGSAASAGMRIVSALTSGSGGIYCENDLGNQVRFQMIGSTAAAHAGGAALVMTGNTTLYGTCNGNDVWSYNSNGLSVLTTNAPSSSITGSLTIGDGVHVATSIGIGGGVVYAGGDVLSGAGATNVQSILRTTATTTTTTVGAKDSRQILLNNTSTANAGGDVTWAVADTTTGRWAAITGDITANSSGSATGNLAFATKTNTTDTALTERLIIKAGGDSRFSNTTSASSSITGALTIGDGSTSATSIGIGGGNINAGATITGANVTAFSSVATATVTADGLAQSQLALQIGGVQKGKLLATATNYFSFFDAPNSTFVLNYVPGAIGACSWSFLGTEDATAIGTASITSAGGATFAKTIGLGSVSAPGSPFMGQIWNDSTRQGLMTFAGSSTANGIKQCVPGVLVTTYTMTSVASTNAETSIVTSGTSKGTYALPANYLVTGKVLRVTVRGIVSNLAAATLNIKVKAGSTSLASTGVVTLVGTLSAAPYEVSVLCICTAVGASGNVNSIGSFDYDNGTTKQGEGMGVTASTIDTTASQTLDVTATWGAASASNTITGYVAMVEALN